MPADEQRVRERERDARVREPPQRPGREGGEQRPQQRPRQADEQERRRDVDEQEMLRHVLWNQQPGAVPARRQLCRQSFARGEARRSPGRAADQVRTGRQSDDRKGALGLKIPESFLLRADEVIE